MRRLLQSSRSLFVAAAAVALAACAADPVAPGADLTPAMGVLKGTATVKVLERAPHLKEMERASLTITAKRGGTLSLPTAGLTVSVPAGAIRRGSLTITVTAAPGKAVAYDFQPHGTVFAKSLTVTQDLGKTSWKNLGGGALWGGYFPSILEDAALRAVITESFSVRITTDGDKRTTSASFDIGHFSGYVVSTGRADGEPDGSLGM